MVHEGNKDEADKCFNLAKKYFEEGNREKAQKFAIKAQKLFPSQSFNDFIDLLNRLNTSQSNETSSSNRSSRADRSQDNENVRQRTSGSHSRPSSLSREYTQDQLDAVKKVKRCKDYYEILGVSKDTTDSDLKKAYRKLALQFHPDKNKAPGADEAFKAVGNAFAVLSDAEKKKNYDLFGHEELSQRSRNSSHMYNTSRGFEGLLTRFLGGLGLILKHYGSILVLLIVLIMLMGFWFLVLVIIGDVTAEELFNMFFGGGFPNSNGGVYVRRNGRWERPRYRNNTRRHSHDENQADQSGFSVILQLMPLILIVVLSLASSFFSSDPIYSLSATTKYNVVRTTRNLRINYFVKSDFNADSNIDIRRLEKQVEESYITTLRNGCYREKTNRDHMMAQARMFGDAKSYKRAYEAKTPSCDALNQLYYS